MGMLFFKNASPQRREPLGACEFQCLSAVALQTDVVFDRLCACIHFSRGAIAGTGFFDLGSDQVGQGFDTVQVQALDILTNRTEDTALVAGAVAAERGRRCRHDSRR